MIKHKVLDRNIFRNIYRERERERQRERDREREKEGAQCATYINVYFTLMQKRNAPCCVVHSLAHHVFAEEALLLFKHLCGKCAHKRI